MIRVLRRPAGFVRCGLLGCLLAAAVLAPGGRDGAAQPPVPLPPELAFVPADAAAFVHADATRLWQGKIAAAIRTADPKVFTDAAAKSKAVFGVTPDQLKSVTAFWPRLKSALDVPRLGVVLAFREAYDPAKLKAGLKDTLPAGLSFTLHTPDDRLAVLLVGLEDQYAKPAAAGKPGPLAAAVREAAAGTHAVVAAVALADLPAEFRGDDLPPNVRPFQPIIRADTLTALLDLDKEVALEVRVAAPTARAAADVEKALGVLVAILKDGLRGLDKDRPKDADKSLVALLDALRDGVDAAKPTTAGIESRVRVAIPADLPYGPAIQAATQKVRTASARVTSQNNLKQIALAMHNHESQNNTFPPAAIVDKAGKPLLSWRVMMLPYLEEEALYKRFNLDEAWDSDTNKKLLDLMPKVYAMPGSTAAKASETHYQALVGNGALFDTAKGVKIPAITDGTSNTIMVATAAVPVPWTKPDDLAFDPEKDATKLLGFFPGEVCSVALADGSVRTFTKNLTKKTLHAYITRAGAEVIDDKDE